MRFLWTMLSGLLATPASAGPLLIEDVRTIDTSGAEPVVTERTAVLVVDGRVARVGRMKRKHLPDEVQRLDGAGLTLMPGLADMHVHLWDEGALGAYLGNGITTVRNLSGMPFHLELQRRIEAGELAGPRLLTSGPILNSAGPNQQINHQLVETAEQARQAVRDQHAAGYERLKLYSNLKREPYEAVLTEANALGLRVTGHTPEGERLPGVPDERPFVIAFDELLDDGFETIEHVESIAWHGLAEQQDDEAGLALAKRIADAGVTVTPTLVAHRNLVRMASSKGAFHERPEVQLLNPVIRQLEQPKVQAWASQPIEPAEQRDSTIRWLMGLLHDAGVPVVTGSDAGIFSNPPGVSLFDELELMVEAGYTPYEVLRASTHQVAVVLDEQGKTGCIQVGCTADLALYTCDPLVDIGCVRRPHAVVRQGIWHDQSALDALVEQSKHQDPERTVTNLAAGMAAQGTPIDPAMLTP